MNRFTKEMVDDYAEKLLFELTPEENKMVLDEFEIIDRSCDLVNTIPGISAIEPMTHCLDDFVVELREDVAEPSVDIDELLRNADETNGREVELPKVVD